MKLTRHQADSVQWELKQHGMHIQSFPKHMPCSTPKHIQIAQTTCMFRSGNEYLLYYDEGGPFLNQRMFSPYECVFIDDLPHLRPKDLGIHHAHIP